LPWAIFDGSLWEQIDVLLLKRWAVQGQFFKGLDFGHLQCGGRRLREMKFIDSQVRKFRPGAPVIFQHVVPSFRRIFERAWL
jgi:hypothetical protein